MWPILDRELSRLADKYRLPIVLCDLEGRSRREVARQLAIPEGTLSSRLATARKKLAARLARYGFAVSAASLGTLLTEKTATASLSLSLLSSTTKAALVVAAGPTAVAGTVSATVSTLTEGVLKTMFLAKIKTATLVLCSIAALGVGTGGVYYQTRVGAADSPQVDRVVQDNRKNTSELGERNIDKLKRENEHLKKALEDARMEKQELRLLMAKLKSEAKVLEAELVELKRTLAAERFDTKRAERETEEQKRKVAELLKKHADSQPKQRANPPAAGADKLDQILERLERLEKRLDRLEKGRQ